MTPVTFRYNSDNLMLFIVKTENYNQEQQYF